MHTVPPSPPSRINGTVPSRPVGDPESLPPDPTPPPSRDPGDPVRAPKPRDPDLPAVEPGGPARRWLH